MKTRSFAAVLAGTTALVLPLMATPPAAQTGPCADLLTMVNDAGDTLRSEFSEASRIAESDDATQCTLIIAEVERLGGMSDTATASETETRDFTASETVTATVEVEQKAVVDGEVIVGLPDPEVSVEQPGAEVTVRESAGSVTINEQSAEIIVRQQQASITVDMPRPTITIEQPAPEIIITMPRPGVSMERAAPRVEVMMADPRVTVTQADPTLDVAVDARFVDPDSPEAMNASQDAVIARTERLNAQGTGSSDAEAAVRISKGEATVNVMEGEGEAEVAYNRAQPSVRYEAADPEISFTSQGEPRVEIRRMGEPRVTFLEEAGTDEASNAQPQQAPTRTALSGTERNRMLGQADMSGMNFRPTPVRVSDLVGKDVITRNGEAVGEISRIVTNNSLVFAVVEHGGFLGLGESEAALPLRRIAIHGDEAMLLGLTEDELEKMPDYDPAQNRMLRNEDELEIRMIDG